MQLPTPATTDHGRSIHPVTVLLQPWPVSRRVTAAGLRRHSPDFVRPPKSQLGQDRTPSLRASRSPPGPQRRVSNRTSEGRGVLCFSNVILQRWRGSVNEKRDELETQLRATRRRHTSHLSLTQEHIPQVEACSRASSHSSESTLSPAYSLPL